MGARRPARVRHVASGRSSVLVHSHRSRAQEKPMSQPLPELRIEELSTDQRLELIGLLWDSIPETAVALPVPEWHRKELERRLAQADTNPEAAVPWDQVRGRLRETS